MIDGMLRLVRLVLIPLAACGCAAKPAPTDAQEIVGDWWVVDFQSPTGTEDRGQRRKHTVVTEGTWSQQFQGDRYEDFEYALDPTQSPKHIDLIYTNKAGKRLTVRGIYEIPDHERLRVCFGSPPVVNNGDLPEYVESVRPTAFEPKTGPLISYRRQTQ
jgi:uncharacterized protein (TIGR03067 family)